MSRRRPVMLPCAEPGCKERARYEVATVKEDRELRAKPWRCLRHLKPQEVLVPGGTSRGDTLVCTEAHGKHFWYPEGGVTGSGFAHGPGFMAWADDFPVGTRLVVTARIEAVGEARPAEPAASVAETMKGQLP